MSLSEIFHSGDDRSPEFVFVAISRGLYYVSVTAKAFMLYFIRDCVGIESTMEQASLLAAASACMMVFAGLGSSLSSILFRYAVAPRFQTVAAGGLSRHGAWIAVLDVHLLP